MSLRSVLDNRRAALEPVVFAELDAIVRFWDQPSTRQ
jgi:hypothetical protein